MGINNFITGYAVINIKGENIEAFANSALARDITIRGLKPGDNGYRGTVDVKKLAELRYLAHLNAVYFTVVSIGGMPKFIRSLKAYRVPALIFGLTLIFLVFYCQCILGVRVDTDGDITASEEARILSLAEDYGIAPGIWRRHIDWDAAAHAIMSQYSNLAWVGFERSGVILTVEIVAKDVKDPEAAVPGDVVANKDGVIKSLLVLNGQARVEVETPVKKGEVIISGEIYYLDPEGNTVSEPSQVHAKGLVEAAVWYTGEASVALKRVEPVATGRKSQTVVLNWQGQDYMLWGGEDPGYEDWQTTEKTLKISESLNFTTFRQVEVTPKVVESSQEEALTAAKKQAYAAAIESIPKKGEIVDKQVEILDDAGESGKVRVRVTVETRERIGKFQGFTGNF